MLEKGKMNFGRKPLTAVIIAVLMLLSAFAATLFIMPDKADTVGAAPLNVPDTAGYQEVVRQTTVPAGYTAIKDEETLNRVLKREAYSENNYILMADIDLGSHNQTPHGMYTYSSKFMGVLDGNGYTITYHTSAPSILCEDAGLFKQNLGTVKNLKVNVTVNCARTETTAVGAIASHNLGIIENCSVAMTVSITKQSTVANDKYFRLGGVTGYQRNETIWSKAYSGSTANCTVNMTITGGSGNDANIGGVVGLLSGGSVRNCVTTVNFDLNNTNRCAISGGIAGYVNHSGTMSGNYSSGSIFMEKTNAQVQNDSWLGVGGVAGYIAGWTLDNNYTNVDTSINVGASAGDTRAMVGGFVGRIGATAVIRNSTALGTATATVAAAASAGYAGGFAAAAMDGTSADGVKISDCAAAGNVSLTGAGSNGFILYAGGFIGKSYAAITSCSSTGNVIVSHTGSTNGSIFAAGFIGNHDGSIRRSTASGTLRVTRTQSTTTGVLAGGITGCMSTTIEDTTYTGATITIGASGAPFTKVHAGALAGVTYGNKHIVDCSSSANITVYASTDTRTAIGGIIGTIDNETMTIKNCTYGGNIILHKSSGTTGGDVGGIVGRGSVDMVSCTFSGNITVNNGESLSIGGIAGSVTGKITSCGAAGSITAGGKTMWIGGLIGTPYGSGVTVSLSKSRTNITATATAALWVGGLVGHCSFTIEKCYYYGGTITINGTGAVAGGIAGAAGGEAVIKQCLVDSSAMISSTTGSGKYIGGLVGLISVAGVSILDCYTAIDFECTGTGDISALGGIVGNAQVTADIRRCYQTADLSTISVARGVVGTGSLGTIYGVFYNSANTSTVGTAFNTASGDPETFGVGDWDYAQFDLIDVWQSGYGSYLWPILRFANTGDIANRPGAHYVSTLVPNTNIRSNNSTIQAGSNAVIDENGVVYRLNLEDNTAVAIGMRVQEYDSNYGKDDVHLDLRSSVLLGNEDNYVAYELTSVGAGAFFGFNFVSEISIAEGITDIGENAFRAMSTNLKIVNGAAGLRNIGAYAFAYTFRLVQISLGNGLETIGAEAFSGSGIQYVSFGQGMRAIGDRAFMNCTSLLSASFWGDRPQDMGVDIFSDVPTEFEIRYSSSGNGWSSIRAWHNKTGWKINYQEGADEYKVQLYGGVSVLNSENVDDQGIKYTVISDSGPYTVMVGTDSATARNNSGYRGFNNGRVIIPQKVKLTSDSINLYNVIRVGQNAFTGNSTLKSIDLGDNVATIGVNAFTNCANLSELFFRGAMPERDGNANVLTGSANATVIAFSDVTFSPAWGASWSEKEVYKAQTLVNNEAAGITYTVHRERGEATVGSAAGGDNRVNSSKFERSDAVISEYVFYEQNFYRVTALDRCAFYNNTTVRTISLPATLTTVGDMSLRLCPNLTSISVSSNSKDFRVVGGILYDKVVITATNQSEYLGYYTYNPGFVIGYDFSTRLIKAPEAGSTTSLNLSLTTNKLNLVLWIENYAFAGNKRLTTLNTGNVEIIGDSAFDGSALTSLTLGSSVTEIGDNAFFNCNIPTVTIGANVASIGDGAFRGCTSLTSFTVSGGNTRYISDAGALYERIAASVKLLQYPAGRDAASVTISKVGALPVVEIAARAFDSARYINSLTLSDEVLIIGYMAMTGCVNLRTLYIGKNVNSIDGYALFDCVSLTGIEVAPENEYYLSDENGVLFDINMTRLIAYPAGAQRISYTVVDSVTEIEPFAFSGARSLRRVILPASITRVGDSSFAECNRLSSAYFKGDAPENFGKYVFSSTADDFTIYYRESAAGWGPNYFGYNAEIYNAISEVPNDVINAEAYIFVIVDSFGAPIPGIFVRFGNLEKATSPMGIVTFTMPDADTAPLYIYDTNDRYNIHDNDAFALDKTVCLSYITMIDKPWVMGVSVKGTESTPWQDINSQTANVNISRDNTADPNKARSASNPVLYETLTIKVDGFCASIYYIGEYRLIQDGMIIHTDNNSNAGIANGMYTLRNIPYYKFIPDMPIYVEMDIMSHIVANELVETLSCELNINIFVFDKPIVENMIGDGFVLDSAPDIPLFGGFEFSFGGDIGPMQWEITHDTIRLGLNLEYSSSDDEDDLQDLLNNALNNVSYYSEPDPDESEFTMSLAGYMILRYSQSDIVLESCHIVGTISYTYVYTKTQMVYVVPVRLEVYLTVSATASLNFYLVYNDDVTDMEIRDSSLELAAGVTLRGGIGCDFASVGIYGKAVLTFKIQIPDFYLESAKLYGELGFYVKVNLKIFKLMFEFPLIQGTWVIYSSTGEKSGYETPFSYRASIAPMLSMSNYELMSAEEEGTMVDPSNEGFEVATAGTRTVKVFKDNVISGDYTATGYDQYNYAKLVWSELGADGIWGATAIIDDNGMTDGEYRLYEIDGDIYMVYTQMKTKLADGDGMEQYAAGLEVKIAKLGANGWVDITQITNNDTYDFMPRLTKAADGKLRLVWANNTENDIFGVREAANGNLEYEITTANSIYKATLTDGTWGQSLVASGLHTVTALSLSGNNITFILDDDCDLMTTKDRGVYLTFWSSAAITSTAVLNNARITPAYNPSPVNQNDYNEYMALKIIDGAIYYLNRGNLYDLDNVALFSEAVPGLTEDFTVISKGGVPATLLFTEDAINREGETYPAIYGIFYDTISEKWGRPILVHEFSADDSVVRCGAYFAGDDFILYALVQGGLYGGTMLFEQAVTSEVNLRVDGVTFDYDALTNEMLGGTPGFDLSIAVTNTGTAPIGSVEITVLDPSSRTVHTETRPLESVLLSGETRSLLVSISVDDLAVGEYKAVVSAVSEAEEQRLDNTAAFKPAYGDLRLEAKHIILGGMNYLLAYVRNDGYLTASGTLCLFPGVYRDGEKDKDGNKIDPIETSLYSLDIGALRSRESKYYLVTLDDTEFYTNAESNGLVTLYVVSNVSEYYTVNNYTSVSVNEVKNEKMHLAPKATAHAVTNTYNRNAPESIDVFVDGAGQTFSGIKYGTETLTVDTHYTYDAATGIVTLKTAGLDTLAVGKSTLTFLFSGDQSVDIQFLVAAKMYTVTWVIDNARVVRTYAEGSVPVYDATPKRAGEGHTVYTFSGWRLGQNSWDVDVALPALIADVTYTATFSEGVAEYTVTFNADGGTFENDKETFEVIGLYGDALVAPVPTKADDYQYSYEFIGWGIELPETIEGEAYYFAMYDAIAHYHNYSFVDYNGTVIMDGRAAHGGTVTPPPTPTRTATDYARYDFIGWDNDPATAITGDIVYRAQYDEVRRFSYVFYDSDGTLIDSGFNYDGWTIDAPALPTRTGYTVAWDKAFDRLTSNLTVFATYTAKSFKVYYVLDNVAYREVEFVTGETITPLAAPTAATGKHFSGWDWTAASGMVMPTNDITVEGSFITNNYAYSFVDYNGTLIMDGRASHGGTVTPPPEPTRTVTDYARYDFSGWDNDPATAITGDIVYRAQYTETRRYSYAFYDSDGQVLEQGRNDEGWTIAAPDLPTRAGYSTAWNKEFDKLTGDTIIVAVYTSQKKSGCRSTAATISTLTLLAGIALILRKRTTI